MKIVPQPLNSNASKAPHLELQLRNKKALEDRVKTHLAGDIVHLSCNGTAAPRSQVDLAEGVLLLFMGEIHAALSYTVLMFS